MSCTPNSKEFYSEGTSTWKEKNVSKSLNINEGVLNVTSLQFGDQYVKNIKFHIYETPADQTKVLTNDNLNNY